MSNQNQRKSLGSITSNEMSDNKDNSPSNTKNSLRSTNRALVPKVVFTLSTVLILLVLILFLVIFYNSDSEAMVAEENKDLTISEKKTDFSEVNSPDVQLNNELKLAAIGPIERLIICDEGETPKNITSLATCQLDGRKPLNSKILFGVIALL